MKNIFYNSVGFNTACITLTSQGKEVKLHYQLNDNPVQHEWQRLQQKYSSNELVTFPMTKFTVDEITQKLKSICDKLDLELVEPLTQEKLNVLHNMFVSSNCSHDWAQLNMYIHIAESILADKFGQFNSHITFKKKDIDKFSVLKEEHKLWLTTEEHWGDLLLAYETVGKDWFDVCKNEDDLSDLNVKSTIGTETKMIFHTEYPFPKHIEKRVSEWAKRTKLTELDNLNKLSLGCYYLGHLIITDELLKFHPVISDWYVPNHKCKLAWNTQVLGKDTKLTNIEFFNSDLAYETAVKHAGIEEYV